MKREDVKYAAMIPLLVGSVAGVFTAGYYGSQIQTSRNNEILSVTSDARNLRHASGLEDVSLETRSELYATLDKTIQELEQHPQVMEIQRQNEYYQDKSDFFLGLTLLPMFGLAALAGKMWYDIYCSRRKEREEMNRRKRVEMLGTGIIA